MTTPSRSLRAEIVALAARGVRNRDISIQLGCSPAYVSNTITGERYAPSSSGIKKPRRSCAPSANCQRPDARKGFATCGDPKMKTFCGETLGVCAYHYEATRPLGRTKL